MGEIDGVGLGERELDCERVKLRERKVVRER